MKKQWMRLLSLVLCLSMLVSVRPAAYAAEGETAATEAETTESTAPETMAATQAAEASSETTGETEAEEPPPETTAETTAVAEPEESIADTEPTETAPEKTADTDPERNAALEAALTAAKDFLDIYFPEGQYADTIAAMTDEEWGGCYAAFLAVGDIYEALENENDIAAFDEAYAEILDEINIALESGLEEEPPTVITYAYEGDPLGRTGSATIYHSGSEAAASDGDSQAYLGSNVYNTQAEAGAYIRSQMKLRAETISLTYVSSSALNFETLAKELLDLAFVHTGVPTEGDYLYWQWGHWDAECSYSNYSITITYSITYYTTAAQETLVDSAVTSALASLNISNASDDQKVRRIYEYICQNIIYDYSNLTNSAYTLKYTAYAAIINKTAVCQGYAVLFYRMLLEVGIDCRVIVGTSSGVNHAWNIVGLDGKYYNADTTWDAGESTYSYYLKCPANFLNHTRKSEYDTASFQAAYPMSSTDREETETSETHVLKYVAAKEATSQQAGNVEYWVCTSCGQVFLDSAGEQSVDPAAVQIIAITRLYNPASGEHLLASSQTEINNLTAAGWSVDGILCNMGGGVNPVYRLYNPYSGEHLYTMVTSEISNLVRCGWKVDGIMAYCASSSGTPIYRLYNEYAPEISSHLLSTSQKEMLTLTAQGDWHIEGIALYAAK